ncbi:MAG: hypothetical protein HY234_04970 [Acidobacteria bacterium]|nr:hypothetical protein [Acidobacteriota bacterium]
MQLVPAEEAARRSQLGLRQLFRLVEAGHVHFVKTSEGQLLICLDSLREV